MALGLSGSPSGEYEDIVRHSEGKTSNINYSVNQSTSDDPPLYESLGKFSLKNEKYDRQKCFTYPSVKLPTKKKEDNTILQKTKKMLNTEEIGYFVGKKCTKLKKCVESFKHKGKESGKPLSVSEYMYLSSKQDTVSNTYQPDVTRPKLPKRTKSRPPAAESSLTNPPHYMTMTYKPTEGKAAVYQNTKLQSEHSSALVVNEDGNLEPEDDYLRPEPRQTCLYREYLQQKQRENERKKAELIKEEPCSDNLEQEKRDKTSGNGDDSDYETMGPKIETGAEHLLSTSAGNGSQIEINGSSKEEKSLDISHVSIGSENTESETADISETTPPTGLKQLNMKGVVQVLKDLNLEKYADIFEANKIDGRILARLDTEDFIKELGMKKLEAYRLDNFIKDGHVPS